LSQLALPLRLADHAVFESFWPAGNDAVLAMLEALAGNGDGPGCWLWGAPATGKTHLLQAVCERLGDRAMYLPLGQLARAGPGILDGMAARSFVCIDEIDRSAGHRDWELALFDLCNQLADTGGTLLAAARTTPRECAIELPDLKSRLTRLPVFRLQALPEPERVRALQLRAAHRGLDLPDETAHYLLGRSRRDMASLYHLLDELDAAALQAQRRLTIPFVRDVMSVRHD